MQEELAVHYLERDKGQDEDCFVSMDGANVKWAMRFFVAHMFLIAKR